MVLVNVNSQIHRKESNGLRANFNTTSHCVSSGNSLGLNSKIEDGLNPDKTLILRKLNDSLLYFSITYVPFLNPAYSI